MYANFGINDFEATIKKSTFGFIQLLAKSTNSPIVTIGLWIVRIDNWKFLQKTLYIATEFRLQMLVLLLVLYNVCKL